MTTLVTIELVAQTATLLEGWKRLRSGRGGTSGCLVGIKRADFSCPPRMEVPEACDGLGRSSLTSRSCQKMSILK